MNEETGKTGTTARKTAHAITVNSPATRSSIDELCRDNPGKSFVYCSVSAPEASLQKQGLVPVKGKDGEILQVGNRIIVECTTDLQEKEVAEQFEYACDAADAVRDPNESSDDVTAAPRKPKTKKSKRGVEK